MSISIPAISASPACPDLGALLLGRIQIWVSMLIVLLIMIRPYKANKTLITPMQYC